MKSKGGNFVVKYCMNLSDEKKETAIKIALESKGNVRKRRGIFRLFFPALDLGKMRIFK